ncbi:MAG: hypothetical protein IKU03_09780 [Bacteroidales bacterium]|nr:hypothetical protein [Bacteroidales bacterium]
MYLDEDLFIDFLSQREILWTGINFSKARFTKQGFEYPQEVMQYYFNGWNTSIINNQKKYDIRLSFRKPIMRYDLALVTKLNKGVKIQHLLTDVISHQDILNEERIREYFSTLAFNSDIPYALSFIVESFDSITKRASIWVVISHTPTSQVVLAENFLKKPGGFGTANYWGRTFYDLLFDIKTSAFIRWKNLVQERISSLSEEGQ